MVQLQSVICIGDKYRCEGGRESKVDPQVLVSPVQIHISSRFHQRGIYSGERDEPSYSSDALKKFLKEEVEGTPWGDGLGDEIHAEVPIQSRASHRKAST